MLNGDLAWSTAIADDVNPSFPDISKVDVETAGVMFQDNVKKTLRFECSECGWHFASKHSLNMHIQSHLGVFYKCDECGKCLQSVYSLKAHQKTHSSTRIKCQHCPKTFTREAYLKYHMICHGARVHCFKCDRSFKNELRLKNHDLKKHRLHDLNFVCGCGKRFIRQYHYFKHQDKCNGVGRRPRLRKEHQPSCVETADSTRDSDEPKELNADEPPAPINEKVSSVEREKRTVICKYCGEERGEHEIEQHQYRMHIERKSVFFWIAISVCAENLKHKM